MDDNIPGLDDLLNSIRGEGESKSSSALAVAPKKPDDLVEEEIDSQILSILGLEDVFDLTYEEYATLLKEAAVKGRMPSSQMTTEATELVTNELKRVRGKEGKFKVKKKKIDINKVMNRRVPSPQRPSAQSLVPAPQEQQEDNQKIQKFLTGDLPNRLDNVSKSLDSVSVVLREQLGVEKKVAEEERKLESKTEKKKRESNLEKKDKKQAKEGVKKLKAPALGFFDNIKRYFGNILAGSVILSIVNWFKDPANQNAINSFSNFITEHAPLILGGILAIALLPVVATLASFTGAILGGIGVLTGAITSLAAFIVSIPGLLPAAAIAGGAGLAGLAVKGVETIGKKLLYGGGDLVQANEILDKKLAAAGITKQGKDVTKGHQQQRRKGVVSGKQLTPEQEKIFQEVKAERARLEDIRKRMDAEIKAEMDKVKPTGRKVKGGRQFTAEDQRRREQAKQQVIQKYNKEINLDKGETATGATGDTKVISVSHPETGSGFGIEGVTDAQGRPVAFSKPAAEAFARMMKDSNGQVKGSDVASSMRSASKNAEVKGAPASPHLSGIAMDIHGTSGEWIRQHGAKYGWVAHDYPGTHGGHFVFGGPGITQPRSTSPAQVPRQSTSVPSIPSPTGRSNIAFLPMGGGSNQQVTSGASASQATVPSFSAQDPNNVTFMTVKSIYNIIG